MLGVPANVARRLQPARPLHCGTRISFETSHVASAAAGLARTGVAEALRERAAAGRPVLGICVGMQLLFEESDEGGAGLGLLRGQVRRLEARRVPHMGWNTLAVRGGTEILAGLDGADVYFAHSYAARPADAAVAGTAAPMAVAAATTPGRGCTPARAAGIPALSAAAAPTGRDARLATRCPAPRYLPG